VDFDLGDEQRMLKDSIDRLVDEQYDFGRRSKYLAQPPSWSRELWRRFAEMGLLGLPFAEADGGFGGGPVETMLMMEAVGRGLLLEPYLATVVLGGGFLRLCGTPSQRRSLIPPLVNGDSLMAFAHSESQARYALNDIATTARREGASWVIDGRKRYVLHGDCAEKLVVSARVGGGRRDEEGIALFVVDANAAGVVRRSYSTQDRLRAADIAFNAVQVSDAALLGEPGRALPVIERVVDAAIAALCAEAVGAMQRAHDLTVEYLKVRKQFGVAIGSFQALQHRAVDMLVMLEQARSMAMYATMMVDAPDALERSKAISAAKVQIGRSGRFIGQQAVQLHGGIGVTEEAQVGHYLRRLSMIELMFGDTDHHLVKLARSGGLVTVEG